MNLFANLARTWAQYRIFRATLTELQMRSDRQLEDMGFTRGDLARVAFEAAELTTVADATGNGRAPTPALRASAAAAG